MVPSPRKRAAPKTTFDTTWNDTDAAAFDPNALPVAKIPRGWERTQELKRRGEGKEKKIWRRFNLRSRADDAPLEKEDDDEEHDARSRAVKRRQHVSPKAMEKTASKLHGTKRAFKATRWDRRKSVLPRKKAARAEDPIVGAEVEAHSEEEDSTLNETAEDVAMDQEDASAVDEDTRATFSFSMDAPTVDDLPDYESLDGHEQTEHDCAPAEEATLVDFFRSPVKTAMQSPVKIEYPQLPQTKVEVAVEVVTDVGEGSPMREKHYTTVQPEGLDRVEEVVARAIEEVAVTEPDISYPALPAADVESPTFDGDMDDCEDEAVELSEIELASPVEEEVQRAEDDADEEFTEASLQLNILREYQAALRANGITPTAEEVQSEELGNQDAPFHVQDAGSAEETNSLETPQSPAQASDAQPSCFQSQDVDMIEAPTASITDGLVLFLTPAKPTSASPAPRKLHSPPPPRLESALDDATTTLAVDDDTVILKDFLTRAAASKAEKAAVTTHRRESLQNRRDSDVIRHALASPRKVLEEKDPNSPNKYDTELTLDLSQTLTLNMPGEALDSSTPGATRAEATEEEAKSAEKRRSSRTKKSRLPAPTSPTPPAPKISIRRTELVVLKKDDTKLLADTTRSNTRKNKQGAFGVTVRLMKIALEASSLPPLDDDAIKELVVGRNVTWDETLARYQENPETLAEAESLSTPDELGMDDDDDVKAVAPKKMKKKEKTSKNCTPKIRRVRGLGSTNGTPGKGLLAPSSLLPDAVQEEKDAPTPKPKTKKTKMCVSASINDSLSSSNEDTRLPTLDVAPVGVTPGAQRKSRLAAPRKVVLPCSTPNEGKENSVKSGSKTASLSVAKGAGAFFTVGGGGGGQSALPRRRGRKL